MSTSVDPTPVEATVVDDEMEDARPVACWSVRECDWRGELPDEMAELLAPPVIVSAQAFVPAAPAAPAPTPVDVIPVDVAPVDTVPVDVVAADTVPADTVPAEAVPATPWFAPPSLSTPEPDVQAEYSPRHAAPEGSAPRFIPPTLARRLRRRRPSHAA